MTAASKKRVTPSPSPTPVRRADALLWVIILASLVMKLSFAFACDKSTRVLDENEYLRIAKTLVREGRFEGTFRPPLYPAYMALCLAGGDDTLRICLGQVVLSCVSLVFVYRMARRVGGVWVARVAVLLTAFDPVLVMFTHRLWSETLFIFFLLWACDLLTVEPPWRYWRWIVAGVLLGLAGLTRPMVLTFVPFVLPWALWQIRRGTRSDKAHSVTHVNALACFGVLAAACAVTLSPWTIRNVVVAKAFILVDSNGPFNFLVGSQPEAAFVAKDDFWSGRFGVIQGVPYQRAVAQDAASSQRAAMQQAVENIRAAPGRFVEKCLWEAGHLWTLDSFLLRHLRNGWYEIRPGHWLIPALALICAAFQFVLVVTALLGLITQPPSAVRGLTLLLCAHATVLFGLTYALSRYSLPLHPFLAIAAAFPLTGGTRLSALWKGGKAAVWRSAVFVLICVGLIAAWYRDVPLLWDMLRTGGANHQYHMGFVTPPHPGTTP